MCIFVCLCVWVNVHVCARVWRLRVGIRGPPPLLSTLFLDAGPLTEPRTEQLVVAAISLLPQSYRL